MTMKNQAKILPSVRLSDTFENRLCQQRLADDREDAYYAVKYPAPVEEKSAAEASTGRTFDRWKR